MRPLQIFYCLLLLGVVISTPLLGQTNAGSEQPTTIDDETAGFISPVADDNLPSMIDPAVPAQAPLEAINIEAAQDLRIGFYSDVGYLDPEGQFIVDVLEQDFAYLTLLLTDAEGRPVEGAAPEIEAQGKSIVVFPKDDPVKSITDINGAVDFGIIGGVMGLDTVTVIVGDTRQTVSVNVISLAAMGYPAPPEVFGAIPWSTLMQSRVHYEGNRSSVAFPESVSALSGETITLSGFMMPLDPQLKQSRFLLTSNPPSCFFHIPGGPAGAVEVLAPEGIDATWDPIVLEGRFETLSRTEFGVIYRLHDAKRLTL